MNRIKELREKNNISMKEAARGIGLPYTTYVGYEKQEREPNSETLIRIAAYFSVSVDYLICRVDTNEEGDNAHSTHCAPVRVMVPQLSEDALHVAHQYEQLDEGDRGYIRGTLDNLLRAEKYENKKSGSG